MNAQKRLWLSLSVLAASCLSPKAIFADDTSRGVPLPAFHAVLPAKFSVSSSEISLTEAHVSVKLTFTAIPAANARLRLTTQRFGWMGEAEPYPDRQFPELALSLDGNKMEVQNSSRAFAGATEITPLLREAEIDPFLITQTPPLLPAESKNREAITKLEQLGAITKDENGYLAHWTADRTLTAAVSTGGSLLTIAYTPRPAYALLKPSDLARPLFVSKVCLTPEAMQQALKGKSATGYFLANSYDIPTSLDEKEAGSVTLNPSFKPDKGQQIVFVVFCGKDSKPVMNASQATPAQTDHKGHLHVLVVERAANQ